MAGSAHGGGGRDRLSTDPGRLAGTVLAAAVRDGLPDLGPVGRNQARVTGGTVRGAVASMLVGGALFVLLAGWLVPWHPVPGGTPGAVAAHSVFSSA